MIILVTGYFTVFEHGRPTSRKEFGTSHGYDTVTGKTIVTSGEPPDRLGAKYDTSLNEWVLEED
jgi:hypothetical protein